MSGPEARGEVRARTTLEGDDVESVVGELLDDLCYWAPHTYACTGVLSGQKARDLVVTLGDSGQRLVIEAKSEGGFTEPVGYRVVNLLTFAHLRHSSKRYLDARYTDLRGCDKGR